MKSLNGSIVLSADLIASSDLTMTKLDETIFIKKDKIQGEER